MLHRPPSALLRPFVKTLWASERSDIPSASPEPSRERVLPTGTLHLVFRMSDRPMRVYDGLEDVVGRDIAHAVVGGTRARYYVKDIVPGARTVGAQFHPGAAQLLLGVPANELAERHTALEDLWGYAALRARERLLEAKSPEQQIDIFESLLIARLPRLRALHPAVAQALRQFTVTQNVRYVAKDTGYSHRRFIALFHGAVGLTPKLYCRVLRFQQAVQQLATQPDESCVDIALAMGYSDQAHFTKDFREFTGLSPTRYRQLAPPQVNHVPIGRR